MNKELSDALLKMKQLDDDMHTKLMGSGDQFDQVQSQVHKLYRDNAVRLEKIIDRYDWPKTAEVGEAAAHAAWTVAYHASVAPALQRKFLAALSGACARSEASQKHLAFLMDRVRVNQGRKQVYGTVLDWVEGGTLGCELEDEAGVAELRFRVGLPPLNDSIALQMKEVNRLGAKPPEDLAAYRVKQREWAQQVGWTSEMAA